MKLQYGWWKWPWKIWKIPWKSPWNTLKKLLWIFSGHPADIYWRKWPNLEPQEPWHSGKGAKPDHVIQLNHREVRTHASYKTTRTWENFDNRGTKMILFSDELWFIANNFKSFANRSKSIIRNNVALCERSESYLFVELSKTFWWI